MYIRQDPDTISYEEYASYIELMENKMKQTRGLMRQSNIEMVDFFKYHSKVDHTR